MVADHLTIRNLTSTPVTLKRVERLRPLGLTKSVTRVFTNRTRADASITASEPFAHEDVEIRVDPFQTVKTDLRTYVDSDKEKLRWIFEAEGEPHQVHTPVPTVESATMRALCDDPKLNLTAVYVTPEAHLAIYSSARMHSWMGELKDSLLLSSLSIPGTHNSATCYVAPPSVRCQAVSPKEQLQNGVRFFDIRVQPQYPDDASRDELILVHGVFPVSFKGNRYLRDLMRDIDDFLDANPSETLIVSIKREGPGTHTDQQLSRILADHYARPDNSKWYTRPKIPTLGDARGKVVLLRRFDIDDRLKALHDGQGWGIDAGGWADNCDHATCPSGLVCIQDFYEVLAKHTIHQKVQYVLNHCRRAGERRHVPSGGGANPFFINFLSASNFWRLGTWPEKIAAKVNPATVEYLCRRHCENDGDWSTGVLVTDWVGKDGDWDLVRCIVGMNARLRLRHEEHGETRG